MKDSREWVLPPSGSPQSAPRMNLAVVASGEDGTCGERESSGKWDKQTKLVRGSAIIHKEGTEYCDTQTIIDTVTCIPASSPLLTMLTAQCKRLLSATRGHST